MCDLSLTMNLNASDEFLIALPNPLPHPPIKGGEGVFQGFDMCNFKNKFYGVKGNDYFEGT